MPMPNDAKLGDSGDSGDLGDLGDLGDAFLRLPGVYFHFFFLWDADAPGGVYFHFFFLYVCLLTS